MAARKSSQTGPKERLSPPTENVLSAESLLYHAVESDSERDVTQPSVVQLVSTSSIMREVMS